MKEILIHQGYWTINSVVEQPSHLYVFGDNDIGKGKGGQAIIRDLDNSIGIPTKKLPSYDINAFYTDNEYQQNCAKIDKAIYKMLKNFLKKNFTHLVFPEDGLGTGLAKLPSKAPKTNKYLENKIELVYQLFNKS